MGNKNSHSERDVGDSSNFKKSLATVSEDEQKVKSNSFHSSSNKCKPSPSLSERLSSTFKHHKRHSSQTSVISNLSAVSESARPNVSLKSALKKRIKKTKSSCSQNSSFSDKLYDQVWDSSETLLSDESISQMDTSMSPKVKRPLFMRSTSLIAERENSLKRLSRTNPRFFDQNFNTFKANVKAYSPTSELEQNDIYRSFAARRSCRNLSEIDDKTKNMLGFPPNSPITCVSAHRNRSEQTIYSTSKCMATSARSTPALGVSGSQLKSNHNKQNNHLLALCNKELNDCQQCNTSTTSSSNQEGPITCTSCLPANGNSFAVNNINKLCDKDNKSFPHNKAEENPDVLLKYTLDGSFSKKQDICIGADLTDKSVLEALNILLRPHSKFQSDKKFQMSNFMRSDCEKKDILKSPNFNDVAYVHKCELLPILHMPSINRKHKNDNLSTARYCQVAKPIDKQLDSKDNTHLSCNLQIVEKKNANFNECLNSKKKSIEDDNKNFEFCEKLIPILDIRSSLDKESMQITEELKIVEHVLDVKMADVESLVMEATIFLLSLTEENCAIYFTPSLNTCYFSKSVDIIDSSLKKSYEFKYDCDSFDEMKYSDVFQGLVSIVNVVEDKFIEDCISFEHIALEKFPYFIDSSLKKSYDCDLFDEIKYSDVFQGLLPIVNVVEDKFLKYSISLEHIIASEKYPYFIDSSLNKSYEFKYDCDLFDEIKYAVPIVNVVKDKFLENSLYYEHILALEKYPYFINFSVSFENFECCTLVGETEDFVPTYHFLCYECTISDIYDIYLPVISSCLFEMRFDVLNPFTEVTFVAKSVYQPLQTCREDHLLMYSNEKKNLSDVPFVTDTVENCSFIYMDDFSKNCCRNRNDFEVDNFRIIQSSKLCDPNDTDQNNTDQNNYPKNFMSDITSKDTNEGLSIYQHEEFVSEVMLQKSIAAECDQALFIDYKSYDSVNVDDILSDDSVDVDDILCDNSFHSDSDYEDVNKEVNNNVIWLDGSDDEKQKNIQIFDVGEDIFDYDGSSATILSSSVTNAADNTDCVVSESNHIKCHQNLGRNGRRFIRRSLNLEEYDSPEKEYWYCYNNSSLDQPSAEVSLCSSLVDSSNLSYSTHCPLFFVTEQLLMIGHEQWLLPISYHSLFTISTSSVVSNCVQSTVAQIRDIFICCKNEELFEKVNEQPYDSSNPVTNGSHKNYVKVSKSFGKKKFKHKKVQCCLVGQKVVTFDASTNTQLTYLCDQKDIHSEHLSKHSAGKTFSVKSTCIEQNDLSNSDVESSSFSNSSKQKKRKIRFRKRHHRTDLILSSSDSSDCDIDKLKLCNIWNNQSLNKTSRFKFDNNRKHYVSNNLNSDDDWSPYDEKDYLDVDE